ncbi:endonuclease/exonuclease/phosphatase family protein [Priestia taiwanensis]|uniref:Exodeoxyribonuclease III n=1 Tax=Priestia taiwanensis TaxID=1347902 RepID=A0A917AZF8_9BACI|nr:endonuclease/exonuclease/phosphatase family protein [Priestia taiwanensis]MBM7365248.1 maltose 6'-phosphate phosphatase [Priestia taiwanensis]GGE85353.1 exodeoxyribonuclease III [Priestia taiwanensis]
MKLLTLNCHSWQEQQQLEKIEHIADVIAKQQYDVIALQEVSQSVDATIYVAPLKKDNYGLLLLEALKRRNITNYTLVWDWGHIGYDTYEEGVAILTRLPIIDQQDFFISKSTDQSYWKTRKIIGVTVSYKGAPISFYSCHLGWWNDEEEPFAYQVDMLLTHAPDNHLAFFLGDFNNNASITGEGYDYLQERGLYDTYTLAEERDNGTTVQGKIDGWDKDNGDMRIDLILANKLISVHSSKVIFNGTNHEVVSDHFGIEVVLNL